MNIAIFTNNYLPNPYGVSTSVEGFRHSLTRMGHRVWVFAPQWPDVSYTDPPDVFRYPSFKVPTKIDFSLVVPFSSRIDALIDTIDFDIVHAQHPNLLGHTAKKVAEKKGIPLVFTWHSLYDRYAHYMPLVPEKWSAHIAMRNAADFARQCDHVIVPTPSIVPIITKMDIQKENISVVPSGIDETLFARPDKNRFRTHYHIADTNTVLVTVSRLTEEKNVLFLAKNVARVLQKNPHVVFLCVGEGDQSDAMHDIFCAHHVDDRVFFPGKAAREDVKDYVAAGDIFVYASTSETQGTIITESMYVGTPVVAVDATGVRDVMVHGRTGLLTREDGDFIHNIQLLINDTQKRDDYGTHAAAHARAHYTTDTCAQKLLHVYEKVLH